MISSLLGRIFIAQIGQTTTAVDEDVVDLKVRVPLDAALRLIVQPGEDLFHPVGLFLGAAVGLELGDPHGAALSGLDGFADVFFEISDAGVAG